MRKRADAKKTEGEGGEEDCECGGRTVLRDLWKEWEKVQNNSKR